MGERLNVLEKTMLEYPTNKKVKGLVIWEVLRCRGDPLGVRMVFVGRLSTGKKGRGKGVRRLRIVKLLRRRLSVPGKKKFEKGQRKIGTRGRKENRNSDIKGRGTPFGRGNSSRLARKTGGCGRLGKTKSGPGSRVEGGNERGPRRVSREVRATGVKGTEKRLKTSGPTGDKRRGILRTSSEKHWLRGGSDHRIRR